VSRRGVIRCGLAAVLFGASTPAASRLARDMSAFSLAGLLYLGAALAVLPFAGAVRPSRIEIRRAVPSLGVAVVLGGAIAPVLLAVGLRHAPAATVALLLNLELAFTVVLAVLVFREHLGRRVTAGTALVVAAGVVLGWTGQAELRWGAVLIAGACLCWAVDNGVTARLDELAPVHITLVKGLVAGSVNLVIGVAVDGAPSWRPLVLALLLGAVGYGASITLWVSGARELGAARGQLVFATAPFVGAVVAWTVFADPVHAKEVVALLLALGGVTFVLRSDHEHSHSHTQVEHDHVHDHAEAHHEHHEIDEIVRRHGHRHRHDAMVHPHPHLPDLHHRHGHAGH
jgi:drug/metabolite transporter (DMT)-like permease